MKACSDLGFLFVFVVVVVVCLGIIPFHTPLSENIKE